MEIGSFIELDIRNTGEYFSNSKNVARLNTARSGIYYALRLLKADTLYLPYYMCPSVKSFLANKGIKLHYYNVDEELMPIRFEPSKDSAVMISNYFGAISANKLELMSSQYEKVIIDNSQAFFTQPIAGCINVYSPRKFFGVPDGSYVVGNSVNQFIEEYIKRSF